MSSCNRLDLQTLGSQPIMSKHLPDHCVSVYTTHCLPFLKYLSVARTRLTIHRSVLDKFCSSALPSDASTAGSHVWLYRQPIRNLLLVSVIFEKNHLISPWKVGSPLAVGDKQRQIQKRSAPSGGHKARPQKHRQYHLPSRRGSCGACSGAVHWYSS